MKPRRARNLDVVPVVIGDSYNAYGVIRGFGEMGIRPFLITTIKRNFVHYSKYIEKHIRIASASKNPDLFVSELIAFGKNLAPQRGMLFPTHDEQLLAIASHKKELQPYFETPFSELDICHQIMDKANFRRICEEQGIPTIKERLVCNQEDALDCLNTLRLPLIAKANIWNAEMFQSFGRKIAILYDEEAYRNHIHRYYEVLPKGELLVQEYIDDCGDLTPNINGFSDREGNLCCVHIAGKIRQFPPRTGTSTAYKAVDPTSEQYAEIVEYTRKILSAYRFYGLFGIEFIYDPVEDCYKVIEMNPRSEFLNYLPTARGQNLAYWIYQYHMGNPVEIPFYPQVKDMTMSVPFNDYFYAVHLNKLNCPDFALTKKQWRKTLPHPREHYGLTAKDFKPFLAAYFFSAISGIGAYICVKNNIPKHVRIFDYFFRGKRS